MDTVKADYGYDAPGVMAGLLGAGLAGLLGGLAIVGLAQAFWLSVLGMILLTVGLVPFGLGVAMVAYALGGKTRMRERLLGSVPWSGDERVLDIGTGAGLLLIGAAKRISRGKATGIDIWSAKDLSNNRRSVTERNIEIEGVADRVELLTADARALPMADGSFDRIVSLLCLHNIESKEGQRAACFEIARVLKPGGVALIADYVPTTAYAMAFRDAGLRVRSSRAYFGTALSLMWMVVAEKPR